MPSPSGFREAESEWGHPPYEIQRIALHFFGFESRHSDQKKRNLLMRIPFFNCSSNEPEAS